MSVKDRVIVGLFGAAVILGPTAAAALWVWAFVEGTKL